MKPFDRVVAVSKIECPYLRRLEPLKYRCSLEPNQTLSFNDPCLPQDYVVCPFVRLPAGENGYGK